MGEGGEGQGSGRTCPFHSGFLEVTPSPFRDLFLFCFTDQLSAPIDQLRKHPSEEGYTKECSTQETSLQPRQYWAVEHAVLEVQERQSPGTMWWAKHKITESQGEFATLVTLTVFIPPKAFHRRKT